MCTAATYKTKDFYFGRTLDYEFSYGDGVTITPRNYCFHFREKDDINNHYQIDIETDGGIDYTDYTKAFGDSKVVDGSGNREGITIIADYKLPCSKMTAKMIQSNFDIYSELDLVKMVISDDKDDWEELERVINKDTKASFYLSPCFGKVTLTRLPEFIMKHADKNIRAQIQIHKIFWDPKEKDV